MSEVTWQSLGLSPWLASACTEMGLKRPTPIQRECIRPALQGRDVMGSAETGSGKTAAFALPVLQALSEDPYGVFAVVLSPARELAAQIADQFVALGANMQIRASVIVGGADMMTQALQLAERPHVVIGTPGRLADHLRTSTATASVMRNVRFLVIDEADRLLELGFASDVGDIIAQLPAKRQTLLFSATMSQPLQRLQKLALNEPHVADLAPLERVPAALVLEVRHETLPTPGLSLSRALPLLFLPRGPRSARFLTDGAHPAPSLCCSLPRDRQYCFVPANVRDAYLAYIVRGLIEEKKTAIVFTSTCRACEELSCTLRALGIEAAPLHSQQPQPKRLAALGRFKQGTLKLLVATDVAARGIDIPKVGCVVNHNVPALPRDFIHRCGRTARAGRAGRAITLASQYDVEVLLAIEAAIGRKMDAYEPEESDVLESLQEVATARRTAVLELTENGFLEREKERRAERKKVRLANEGEEGEEGEDEDGAGAGEDGGAATRGRADEEAAGGVGAGSSDSDDEGAAPVMADPARKNKGKRTERREREAHGRGAGSGGGGLRGTGSAAGASTSGGDAGGGVPSRSPKKKRKQPA